MIRPLDVIMTRRKSIPINDPGDILSGAISSITDGPSHVRIYVGEGVFWEVTFPACRFGEMSELDEAYRAEYDVEIGRHSVLPDPLPINLFQRALIAMSKLEGAPYDLPELAVTQFLNALGLRSIDLFRSLFVCSSGAEDIFRQIRRPWCPGQKIVSPLNIAESPFYRIIDERR